MLHLFQCLISVLRRICVYVCVLSGLGVCEGDVVMTSSTSFGLRTVEKEMWNLYVFLHLHN